MNQPLKLMCAFGASLLLGGCATKPAAEAEAVQYEYVTETGSHIAKKVKKQRGASADPTLEQGDQRDVERLAQDQIRRFQTRREGG